MRTPFQKIKEKGLIAFVESQESGAFTFAFGDLQIDLARNFLNDEVLLFFEKNFHEKKIESAITSFMKGEAFSDKGSAMSWHPLLRGEGKNRSCEREAQKALSRALDFADWVRSKSLFGYSGKPLTTILNIGIGGSDLGLRLANEALQNEALEGIDYHSISHPDSSHLEAVLSGIDPETTLVIYTSKSFTTADAIVCLNYVRRYFVTFFNDANAFEKHFYTSTANAKAARDYGFKKERIFDVPQWIGGRFSIWSAAGLPLMIRIGRKGFLSFLEGANEIDTHFKSTPLQENLPILWAFLEWFYVKYWGAHNYAIEAYDSSMKEFCHYVQQLHMESLGKPTPNHHYSSPVIIGGLGILGQHAYYQLLHEGGQFIPMDFIVKTELSSELDEVLFKNAVAQSRAFLLRDRPLNLITYPKITPKILGQILALYEHKIFTLSLLYGVHAFDQPGVELGKRIFSAMQQEGASKDWDARTRHFLNQAKRVDL